MGTHRKITLSVATLAVCALAACSERAPLPSAPMAPRAIAIHGELPAPVLTDAVTGNDVLLTWSWSDDQDWSFVTFSLSEEGVGVLDAGKVQPYTAGNVYTASWTAYDVSSGDHVYCVKVTAKNQHVKKNPTTTSHSVACDTVTIP